MEKFLEPLGKIIMLKLTSVTQSVVWRSLKVFIYMESSKIGMLPGQKAQGKGHLGVVSLCSLTTAWTRQRAEQDRERGAGNK